MPFILTCYLPLLKLPSEKDEEIQLFLFCQLVRLYLISMYKVVNKSNICPVTFFTPFNRRATHKALRIH